jgi:hypothetical protein
MPAPTEHHPEHQEPEPVSPARQAREDELCVHIFSASAALVGVCLTVIGLFRVVSRLQKIDSLADNFLAVDALGFLIACALSYLGIRSRNRERRRWVEVLADRVFLLSLGIMTLICALIAYELV